MCILPYVGGTATVVPIPDERLPGESRHEAARPRDLRQIRTFDRPTAQEVAAWNTELPVILG
jgi:hypothetical protein